MIRKPWSILTNKNGSTAAEFAMVLPLLLIFLLGLIDAARFIWTYNEIEKATQMGVRMAVATKMIPQGLYVYDFTADVNQGSLIPASSFGGATCNSTGGAVSCSCDTGATCPDLGAANDDIFTAIVSRMAQFYPRISKQNVEVKYGYSGLGYAGNPNGADVSPLITVRVKNLSFTPITSLLTLSLSLPDFASALTMEDGQGTVAN